MGSKQKTWLVAAALWLAVVLTLYWLFRPQLSSIDVEGIGGVLRGLGPWAVLLGGGLIFLQTFIPFLPFIVLAGANVLVFGLWGGFFLTWIGAAAASIVMFWLARTIGREWASQKVQQYEKVARLNRFIEQNGFKTILSVRLFPVIPPVVVNLAAGLSTIRPRAYTLATAIGKMPAVFVESLIGHDLLHFSENKGRLVLILAAFGLLIGFGMRIMKKKIGFMNPGQSGESKFRYRTKERVK